MSKQKYRQLGFSMIEVMASVAVIAFAMVGIFSLVIYNQKVYLDNKNKFIGIMLSQEGTELVRNIRDSNWLNSLSFNNGLTLSIFRIDATGTIKDSIQAVTDINDTNATLKQLGGIYRHDSGTDTIFSRIIQIENIDETGGEVIDGLKITSLVQWQYRNVIRQHQTVVFLYDWRQ